MNTANFAHSAATVAPPPPARRGLISGVLFAGLVAALFLTVAPAEAQTTRTLTLSAIGDNGDRDPATPGLQVDEGDQITITLTVDGLTSGNAYFATTDFTGTAVAETDFRRGGSGTAHFSGASPLWARENFQVPQRFVIVNDSAPEPDETIVLTVPRINEGHPFHTATDTFTYGDPLTITIRQNDGYIPPPPSFSIAVDETARNEGQTAVFTVTLAGSVTAGGVTVDWAVTGAGITSGDYTVSGAGSGNRGTLTFTALGSQALNFAIAADSVTEDAETLTVTLSNPSSGSVIGTASASTTIAASDQPHARMLTVTGLAMHAETDSDSNAITYTVTMSGNRGFTAASTTVTWTVTHGTTADADFVAAADRSGTVEFTGVNNAPAGFRTFTVNIAGDDLNEAAESFSVQVSVADPDADGGTGYGPPVRTTITDDDPITATLSGSATADEGASGDVTVTLSGGDATAPVVIAYTNAEATGMLTIPTGTTTGTLTLTATDDMLSEDAETLSVVPGDFTATSAGTVTVAGSATLTINADSSDDITVTIAAPAAANTGRTAEFAVAMSNPSAAAVTVAYTVALTVDGAPVTIPPANITDTVTPIAAGRTGGVISVLVPADVDIAESGELRVTLDSVTVATGGGMAGLGAATTATVEVISDDPAAREARLEAPLASAGRGVGQVAVAAVQQRLRVGGAGAGGGSSLTIAGRDMAAGAEVLAAEFLAGGYATGDRDLSTEELLRQSAFNLAGRDGGRGFNFWGSGGYVSAEGDHDGVDYDGDTSAFTVGIDTGWKGGLVGVAVTRSDGDTDFTVTADGTEHTLETEVTGFHPYLTRRLNRSQLWLTAGFGRGDAELKEPDNVVIKTDITVTTAAFGITQTRGDLFTGNLSALYSRAKLDAAAGRNALNATTADSIRLTADADIGWTLGAWRPFITFALRHDSGDGDTGGAADLGGGVEYRGPTVLVRLAGSGHIQGQGADEQRASLTVRRSTGNFDLSLNLAADGSDIDTARLLHGEWRF